VHGVRMKKLPESSLRVPNGEFEQMLTGGHPNWLGRTLEVVETVFADSGRLADLYSCYFARDEVVRLRTSNAMKRVCKEHPDWLVPYLDGFLSDVAAIDQASTQWTLAQLFLMLQTHMSTDQRAQATALLQRNLARATDWIVLNNTIETLGVWSTHDAVLAQWLRPRLVTLCDDPRTSVAGRARKWHAKLGQ
jgi:hypothetical protein